MLLPVLDSFASTLIKTSASSIKKSIPHTMSADKAIAMRDLALEERGLPLNVRDQLYATGTDYIKKHPREFKRRQAVIGGVGGGLGAGLMGLLVRKKLPGAIAAHLNTKRTMLGLGALTGAGAMVGAGVGTVRAGGKYRKIAREKTGPGTVLHKDIKAYKPIGRQVTDTKKSVNKLKATFGL